MINASAATLSATAIRSFSKMSSMTLLRQRAPA
jgi:hypothetical protein